MRAPPAPGCSWRRRRAGACASRVASTSPVMPFAHQRRAERDRGAHDPLVGGLAKQVIGLFAVGLDADAFEIELRQLEAREGVAAGGGVTPVGDGGGQVALAVEASRLGHAEEPHRLAGRERLRRAATTAPPRRELRRRRPQRHVPRHRARRVPKPAGCLVRAWARSWNSTRPLSVKAGANAFWVAPRRSRCAVECAAVAGKVQRGDGLAQQDRGIGRVCRRERLQRQLAVDRLADACAPRSAQQRPRARRSRNHGVRNIAELESPMIVSRPGPRCCCVPGWSADANLAGRPMERRQPASSPPT